MVSIPAANVDVEQVGRRSTPRKAAEQPGRVGLPIDPSGSEFRIEIAAERMSVTDVGGKSRRRQKQGARLQQMSMRRADIDELIFCFDVKK